MEGENISIKEDRENTEINNITVEEEEAEENKEKVIFNKNQKKVQTFTHLPIITIIITIIIKSVNGKKNKEVIKIHKFHKRNNGTNTTGRKSHIIIMIVHTKSIVMIRNNGTKMKEKGPGKNKKERWKK